MEGLSIAISTYGADGLLRVVRSQLPRVAGVQYVISWQNHQNAPMPEEIVGRDDIAIYRFDLTGQSLNRNNSIEKSQTDLVLIGDDDLTYHPAALEQIVKIYEEHPEMALCTFRVSKPGDFRYPDKMHRFGRRYPKGYSVGACDISFRKSQIGDLRFNPEFGLNSKDMHSGEDSLFLLAAIRRGLDCRFYPLTIADHPHESTGAKRGMSGATLRGMGCILTLEYPVSFPARIVLKAYRLAKAGNAGFLKSLRYLISGALRAPHIKL